MAAAPVAGLAASEVAHNREQHYPEDRSAPVSESNPYHLQGIASHVDERAPAMNATRDDTLDEAALMPPVVGRTFSQQRYDPTGETQLSDHVPDLTRDAHHQDRSVEYPVQTSYPDRSVSNAARSPNPVLTQTAVPAQETNYFDRSTSVAPDYQRPVAAETPLQSNETKHLDRSISDVPSNSNPVPTQTFVLPIQSEAPMNQVQQQEPLSGYQYRQQEPVSDYQYRQQEPLSDRQYRQQEPLSGYQYQQPQMSSIPQYQQPEPVADHGYRQQEPLTNYQSVETQPAPTQPQVLRHESSYGDWMAPAAGGAAVGALGAGAYQRHQQQQQQQQQQYDAIPEVSSKGLGSNAAANDFVYPAGTAVSTEPSPVPTQSTAPTSVFGSDGTKSTTEGLGGLENKGARSTGHIFPSVVRHNTDMSVSNLHIPGEFPKTPGATSSTSGSTATGPLAWEAARE